MTKREQAFVNEVWGHYRRKGRQHLPWRTTTNPYRILVSEVMCQQTQVERVVPKYKNFLKKFPTMHVLATAPLGDVLREWQGLGYNRRAKMLHECAKEVGACHGGALPNTAKALEQLPGIGPYTAGAIMAFAFNTPVLFIETNIRSAFLYHFFKNKKGISDQEILRYIAVTLDREKPREWYAALMDYGAYIKSEFGNQNARSKHYTKQSKFKGSDREIRGAIIKKLASGSSTLQRLQNELDFMNIKIELQLSRLVSEGVVEQKRGRYQLPV